MSGGKDDTNISDGEHEGENEDTEQVLHEEEALPHNIAESVLKREDIDRIREFGLGRGVDATSCTPWIDKSTFQVREVTLDSVLGTEEGGFLQSFTNEVYSVDKLQAKMGASVPLGDKIKVEVDSEMSRTCSISRRSIGKKITTRSIFFKSEIESSHDPQSLVSPFGQAKDDSASIISIKPLPSFEHRLTRWVLRSLNIGCAPDQDPTTCLLDYMRFDKKRAKKLVLKKFREFVERFHITHYVNGIQLGAARYQVVSEKWYQKELEMKGTLGITQLADTMTQVSAESRLSKKSAQLSYIGRFSGKNMDTVCRRTTDEAVVGVVFEPLSVLVQERTLQELLQAALIGYIEEQERCGPFIIASNNDLAYLKVTATAEVVATSKISDATHFSIVYDNEELSVHKFKICYIPKLRVAKRLEPISQYLYAQVGFMGYNPGPLTMRFDAENTHTLMTIHSRHGGTFEAATLENWVDSSDVFYICCKQRFFGRNSYICVKRTPAGSQREEEFITCCVPTITAYDQSEASMLFRLIRTGTIRRKSRDELERALSPVSREPSSDRDLDRTLVPTSRDASSGASDVTSSRELLAVVPPSSREPEREMRRSDSPSPTPGSLIQLIVEDYEDNTETAL